ncbi:hypothetical protein K402DRAFT_14180 [Aulographum hederae CBS 113979]|uniref:Uncharacterized protein n=1 Tax=Aulographum hederae CBS 113979 TaxID=1176131 RepID=A0A6G1H7B5_9PEZI|nr:hypothetical protein K402DRAFT_14180 [Aulographum hederae CBS 113979]
MSGEHLRQLNKHWTQTASEQMHRDGTWRNRPMGLTEMLDAVKRSQQRLDEPGPSRVCQSGAEFVTRRARLTRGISEEPSSADYDDDDYDERSHIDRESDHDGEDEVEGGDGETEAAGSNKRRAEYDPPWWNGISERGLERMAENWESACCSKWHRVASAFEGLRLTA